MITVLKSIDISDAEMASIKYDAIKWDFFSLLDKKVMGSKAEIRSYFGLKTWEIKQNLIAQNSYTTHIQALQQAIQEYKSYTNPSIFRNDLDTLLELWRTHLDNTKTLSTTSPLVEPPVKNIREWKRNGNSFISLFSGAFGLDLGFMGAGFEPLVALDILDTSEETLKMNLPNLPFINEDIIKVPTSKVLELAGLDVGELDVVTGGPPCQPFSTAGKREGLLDPRASPLREFIRFVNEAQPKIFVMEEVMGLLSARLKHIPISERHGRTLLPEEKTGSAFANVVEMLRSTGYNITLSDDVSRYNDSILNTADFGAPQIRNRLIIIGCRDNEPELPEPTHSSFPRFSPQGDTQLLKPWNTFWDATCDLQGKKMEHICLSSKTAKYLDMVPPGGCWRDLPKGYIEEAMGGAYLSGGGKMGFYRRLSWDYPSPTVMTSPTQKGTMLCHPEELRPISIEEYKRIQGFPDDWLLPDTTSTKYLLIGKAVPVYLSHAIAQKVQILLQ